MALGELLLDLRPVLEQQSAPFRFGVGALLAQGASTQSTSSVL